MSVVIETTLGDITVDLFLCERPRACLNFLKLCKIKYYNYNLFHTISRGFIAQTGDPTGSRSGGESFFGVIDGSSKKFFEAENEPRIKHTRPGLISFVGGTDNMIASQFFLTLGEDLTYLDEKHCVFGEVVEGIEVLESINEVICDNDDRPFQDVRITHTVVLDDPYPDPKGLLAPSRSPSPSAERLAGGRIAPDEEVDETSGKTAREVAEMQAEREAKARATILEMVGDIPDADMAPPENVLFVCKLNPITNDDDLEIVFSRFGKIKSCEVIRDRKTGDSLQYAFIEFEDQKSCEDAYFKMDNVLIDDRRLHVDFSQSVSKVKWLGKGKGVRHYDDKGNRSKADINKGIGKGEYKVKNGSRHEDDGRFPRRDREQEDPKRKNLSPSPKRFRKSKSPQPNKRQSRSPERRRREHSKTPEKRGSPTRRRKYSRTPDRSVRRNDRVYSHKRQYTSPKHSRNRNMDRYSPKRKPRFFGQRSRSPFRPRRSPVYNRRHNSTRRYSRSPRRRSRSPNRSVRTSGKMSPEEKSRHKKKPDTPEREKILFKEKQSRSKSEDKTERKKQKESPDRSRSPRRSKSPLDWSESQRIYKRFSKQMQANSRSPEERSSKSTKGTLPSKYTLHSPTRSSKKNVEKDNGSEERSKNKEKTQKLVESRDRSGKDNRPSRERLSSEKTIPIEVAKQSSHKGSEDSKGKRAKTSSIKSKKSQKYSSSEESSSESEEDTKKSKNKKSKRKVESSTDSSSSEESSSSSDEIAKKKRKKRNKKEKKKRSKKAKRRKSSSSDSDSDSSDSSESDSDNHKKKKSKKKRTKSSSESD